MQAEIAKNPKLCQLKKISNMYMRFWPDADFLCVETLRSCKSTEPEIKEEQQVNILQMV